MARIYDVVRAYTLVHQEKIDFSRSMYPDDQGLFDIGSPAGAGSEGDQRGDLLLVFFFQGDQAVPDIIDQLIGPGNTDMNRCVDADRTAAGIAATGAHDDAAGPGDQCFTAGDGSIAFRQTGSRKKR